MEKLAVNGKEYEIIKLLGKGKGGYSYLARRASADAENANVEGADAKGIGAESANVGSADAKSADEVIGGRGEAVVLKQIHHEPCSYYNFGNKIEAERYDYQRLSAAGIRIPQMLEIDVENERIVKEYIDGPTVFELVRDSDEALGESIFADAREMAALAKNAGLNIDYFPTNFVLQGGLLYYVDYECNSYMDEWNFENWGIKYWSRSPEFLDYLKNH